MKELIRYPKDEKGNRIGCLYAYPQVHEQGIHVRVGWSVFAKNETCNFNKKLAREIAKGRAIKGRTSAVMPDRIKKHITDFLFTVNRAFHAEFVHIVDYADTLYFGENGGDE